MKELDASSNARLMRISAKYDNLPRELKPIVFITIRDMLPEKAKGEIGLHLTKLMLMKDAEKKEQGIYDNFDFEDGAQVMDDMIKEVGEDIYYINTHVYHVNVKNEDLNEDETKINERKNTILSIKKMFTQRTITEDNMYIDTLSDYFSVSQETITKGFGVRYKKNLNAIDKIINRKIDYDDIVYKYIEDVISKDYYDMDDNEKEKIVDRLFKIAKFSDYLYVDFLREALNISFNSEENLYEEDIFLCFDNGYLLYYADWLNSEQLVLIEHLINNIYKFVLDEKIRKEWLSSICVKQDKGE